MIEIGRIKKYATIRVKRKTTKPLLMFNLRSVITEVDEEQVSVVIEHIISASPLPDTSGFSPASSFEINPSPETQNDEEGEVRAGVSIKIFSDEKNILQECPSLFVKLYFLCIYVHIYPPIARKRSSAITSSLRACRPPVYHIKMGESR